MFTHTFLIVCNVRGGRFRYFRLILMLSLIWLFSALALGHGGGLDSNGGHTNGSTGLYHCHTDHCEETACNGNCSEGTDLNCSYPDDLEITVINIGQGDATLIATPTRLLLADSGESHWNSHADADQIAATIASRYGEACKTIDYFINSHLHLDHIGYLQATYNDDKELLADNGQPIQFGDNLSDPVFRGGIGYLISHHGFVVKKSLFRDVETHNPNRPTVAPWNGSKTYWNWRYYLASPIGQIQFNPEIATFGKSQVSLGTIDGTLVEVDIVQVDAATTTFSNGCDPQSYFGDAANTARGDTSTRAVSASENDLSVAFILSWGKFQMFVGGDMSGQNDVSSFAYSYHDTESCMADDPYIQDNYGGHLEVYRVNHHGSGHSTNQKFMDFFDPRVSIASVGDNNHYDHVSDVVLERLVNKSVRENRGAVYLTEMAINDSAADNIKQRVIIGDGEAPLSYESSELGDPNISIVVTNKGKQYVIQGGAPDTRKSYWSRD